MAETEKERSFFKKTVLCAGVVCFGFVALNGLAWVARSFDTMENYQRAALKACTRKSTAQYSACLGNKIFQYTTSMANRVTISALHALYAQAPVLIQKMSAFNDKGEERKERESWYYKSEQSPSDTVMDIAGPADDEDIITDGCIEEPRPLVLDASRRVSDTKARIVTCSEPPTTPTMYAGKSKIEPMASPRF